MRTTDCDFLVIGSGLAGLTAALKLSPHGHVIVATKKEPTLSSSERAQGGIACVMDTEDSFADHVGDTLSAGAGLCNEEVAWAVARGGPERVAELAELDSRDVLLAKVAGMLQAPMANAAGLFAVMPRNLATMIQQLVDRREADEPLPEPAEAEPEAKAAPEAAGDEPVDAAEVETADTDTQEEVADATEEAEAAEAPADEEPTEPEGDADEAEEA